MVMVVNKARLVMTMQDYVVTECPYVYALTILNGTQKRIIYAQLIPFFWTIVHGVYMQTQISSNQKPICLKNIMGLSTMM